MTTLESAIKKLDSELHLAPEQGDHALTLYEIEVPVTAARSGQGIIQVLELQLEDEPITIDPTER
jgi:hypothetical protein